MRLLNRVSSSTRSASQKALVEECMCRVLLYPIIPVCHFSPFEHGLTGWFLAGIGGIRGKNNAESSEQVKAVGMSPLARGKR
jgi:hypothetical protein